MAERTLPVPVTLKRFLAPDFVLILGIWLSFPVRAEAIRPARRDCSNSSVLIEHRRCHGSPFQPGGERPGLWQTEPEKTTGRAVRAKASPSVEVGPAGGQAPLTRRHDHDHLAAFELGLLLDLRDGREVVAHPVEKFGPQVLVRHLAATEAQGNLDLVALFEEALHGAHLHVVVVVIDHRPELDLLDLDHLLLLARLGRLLLLLIFVFAVIEQLADGRGCVRGNLDEIEAGGLSTGQSLCELNGAAVSTVLVDQMDFAGADLIVDAWPILLDRRRCSHGATNGRNLLCCCNDLSWSAACAVPCWTARASTTIRSLQDREKPPISQRRRVLKLRAFTPIFAAPRRRTAEVSAR